MAKKVDANNPAQEYTMLSLAKIKPSDKNDIFRDLSDNELAELMTSLTVHGQLHPIVVRQAESGEGKYEIVSGHQRVRAAKKLGWRTIRAEIVEADELTAIRMLLDANVKTRQLSAMEMARAVKMERQILVLQYGRRRGRPKETEIIEENRVQNAHEVEGDNAGQNVPDLSEAGHIDNSGVVDSGNGVQLESHFSGDGGEDKILGRWSEYLAEKYGMNEKTIRRLHKLNDLILPLQEMLMAGRISQAVAEQLAFVTPEEQQALLDGMGEKISQLKAKEMKMATDLLARKHKEADRLRRAVERRAKHLAEERARLQKHVASELKLIPRLTLMRDTALKHLHGVKHRAKKRYNTLFRIYQAKSDELEERTLQLRQKEAELEQIKLALDGRDYIPVVPPDYEAVFNDWYKLQKTVESWEKDEEKRYDGQRHLQACNMLVDEIDRKLAELRVYAHRVHDGYERVLWMDILRPRWERLCEIMDPPKNEQGQIWGAFEVWPDMEEPIAPIEEELAAEQARKVVPKPSLTDEEVWGGDERALAALPAEHEDFSTMPDFIELEDGSIKAVRTKNGRTVFGQRLAAAIQEWMKDDPRSIRIREQLASGMTAADILETHMRPGAHERMQATLHGFKTPEQMHAYHKLMEERKATGLEPPPHPNPAWNNPSLPPPEKEYVPLLGLPEEEQEAAIAKMREMDEITQRASNVWKDETLIDNWVDPTDAETEEIRAQIREERAKQAAREAAEAGESAQTDEEKTVVEEQNTET